MSNDTYAMGLDVWKRWTEMWNGKPALARELAAPRFVLHLPSAAPTDERTITSPEEVERWVAGHLAKFEKAIYRYDAGPFVDTVAGVVAGPWTAELTAAGTTLRFCGMDTVAFREGKIVEYWTLAKETESLGRWTDAVAERQRR